MTRRKPGGRPVAVHLPWEPLGRVLAGMEVEREPVGSSPLFLSRLLGIDNRLIARWQHRNWIGIDTADHICTLISRHPSEIWAEWNDVEIEPEAVAS